MASLPSLAAPAIATGAFTGGPKDDVATPDIYKLTSAMGGGAKPITSIQELRAAIDEADFDLTLDAGIANDFMSKVKGQAVFDKDLLTSRILGTNSDFKSTFNELNEAMKKGALTGTFKDKADQMMCTINDTRSMVDASQINSVKALGGFVNKYTGSKIFSGQDKGAMAGLLGSVVTTSSDLGISGTFTSLAETVKDNGIIGRMTRAVLPIAVRNSDTKLLREMANGPAGSLINVFSPGFTQTFSRSFEYRGNRATSLNSFEDIFGAFRGVQSDWDVLGRGEEGNFAINLFSLMGGSRDFQNLVLRGVQYWATEQSREGGKVPNVPIDPMYALATAYQEVTVGQAIQRDFPRVTLLSVYNARLPTRTGLPAGSRNSRNSNVIDPRLLQGTLGALFGN